MLGEEPQQSEVSRLLAQIRAEYEAGRQGLSGLSAGTAQHKFITARMERMGAVYRQLGGIIGEEAAATRIAAVLDQSPL